MAKTSEIVKHLKSKIDEVVPMKLISGKEHHILISIKHSKAKMYDIKDLGVVYDSTQKD